MQIILDVNPAYRAWRLSTAQEKEWALHILIRRLERYATSICWQRLPDHKDDFGPLVNGIVWKAVREMEKFRGSSQFSTWFYRIAVNDCNKFLRNYKNRFETSLEEEMPSRPEAMNARIDLIALLDGLEGPEHLLFRLVAEGQEFKDIAERLGISRNAAIVRWARLKEKLRDAVDI